MPSDEFFTTFTTTTNAQPFNVNEVLSLMRAMQEEHFSSVMDFNADALTAPCRVCGNIMTMDNRGDVTVCEHVMDALRREFGPAVDAPIMRPMESPFGGVRVYVKE